MPKPQYGPDHQKRRKALLAGAYGQPCPLCRKPMLPGQRLHLDHSLPVIMGGTIGDRITHGSCNEAAGARIGNRRRAARATIIRLTTSRRW